MGFLHDLVPLVPDPGQVEPMLCCWHLHRALSDANGRSMRAWLARQANGAVNLTSFVLTSAQHSSPRSTLLSLSYIVATATQYYYAAGGQRYRSKNEVAKALGIDIPTRAPKAETIGEDGVKVSKASFPLNQSPSSQEP